MSNINIDNIIKLIDLKLNNKLSIDFLELLNINLVSLGTKEIDVLFKILKNDSDTINKLFLILNNNKPKNSNGEYLKQLIKVVDNCHEINNGDLSFLNDLLDITLNNLEKENKVLSLFDVDEFVEENDFINEIIFDEKFRENCINNYINNDKFSLIDFYHYKKIYNVLKREDYDVKLINEWKDTFIFANFNKSLSYLDILIANEELLDLVNVKEVLRKSIFSIDDNVNTNISLLRSVVVDLVKNDRKDIIINQLVNCNGYVDSSDIFNLFNVNEFVVDNSLFDNVDKEVVTKLFTNVSGKDNIIANFNDCDIIDDCEIVLKMNSFDKDKRILLSEYIHIFESDISLVKDIVSKIDNLSVEGSRNILDDYSNELLNEKYYNIILDYSISGDDISVVSSDVIDYSATSNDKGKLEEMKQLFNWNINKFNEDKKYINKKQD